jgi:hypothetical protein
VPCPNCSQTESVTIGQKQYCSHCGMALSAGGATTAFGTAPIASAGPVADIAVSSEVSPTPQLASEAVEAPTAPTAPASMPMPPRPAGQAPSMNDIRPVASTSAEQATPTAEAQHATPNPATSFHARTQSAPRPATLDLRAASTQLPSLATPPSDTAAVAQAVSSSAIASVAPPTVDTATPSSPSISRGSETRIENATAVLQSDSIKKFGGTRVSTGDATLDLSTASSQMAASLPAVATATPATPAVSTVATTEATTMTGATGPVELPNSVATQVDAMASMRLPQPAAATPQMSPADALQMAMSTPVKPQFTPATAIAAVAVVTIMGGYIWVSNYPKMTVKAAGSKAGVEASLPNYMPASFDLGNRVSYSPGELSLDFHTSTHAENVHITQRNTSWDSSSLLENFVTKKTEQYSAVEGQGLTVYMYGAGQASWVNHGIWYTIDGNNRLSRDQLLKIIYSL